MRMTTITLRIRILINFGGCNIDRQTAKFSGYTGNCHPTNMQYACFNIKPHPGLACRLAPNYNIGVQYSKAKPKVQAWLISDALSVRRIFSLVRCNVLAVIDSVAIATTVSNLGEQFTVVLNLPGNMHYLHDLLLLVCMQQKDDIQLPQVFRRDITG